VILVHDGTNQSEILIKEVQGLTLDEDYAFYVTGLNPYESEQSEQVIYRAAGRPDPVLEITSIPDSRTG
jgi:hypothetical protein